MTGRLEGKVAIITGAGCVGPGWGNGRAECVRFAQEGAKIFAVDLKAEQMDETLEKVADFGGEIETHLCDVTDKSQVDAMVAACIERYGRVDILINNVGGSARGGPVEMDEDTWDQQMAFNVKSVYLCCKAVLPHMEEQGSGVIINTGSSAGLRWTVRAGWTKRCGAASAPQASWRSSRSAAAMSSIRTTRSKQTRSTLPRQSIGRGCGELLVGEVDLGDAILHPADAPAAEQLPIGRSYLPGLQLTAKKLVKQGLEVEMFLGLNQHHGTVGQACGNRHGTEQSAETAPHDHHSLC